MEDKPKCKCRLTVYFLTLLAKFLTTKCIIKTYLLHWLMYYQKHYMPLGMAATVIPHSAGQPLLSCGTPTASQYALVRSKRLVNHVSFLVNLKRGMKNHDVVPMAPLRGKKRSMTLAPTHLALPQDHPCHAHSLIIFSWVLWAAPKPFEFSSLFPFSFSWPEFISIS